MTRGAFQQTPAVLSPTWHGPIAAVGSMPAVSTKYEGAGARDAGPLTSSNNHKQVSAGSMAQVKRVATAAARLALVGYALYPLADQRYLVATWNLSKEFHDLAAVEQFLAGVSP